MTSDGKHVLLSGANLHYERKERRKCSVNGLLMAQPYQDNSKNGTDDTEFRKENGKIDFCSKANARRNRLLNTLKLHKGMILSSLGP